jgi:hypothetical protein
VLRLGYGSDEMTHKDNRWSSCARQSYYAGGQRNARFSMNSMRASIPTETELLLGRGASIKLTGVRVETKAAGQAAVHLQGGDGSL